MGLDIYAGSVTRYVAGNWLTIVQQAGAASGQTVVMYRPNEPHDVERDADVVRGAVLAWRGGLLAAMDRRADDWVEDADAPYRSDKPAWSGYGAVVLLAAHLERPDLAPGTPVRKGLRRRAVDSVPPQAFANSEAFKAVATAPSRFPTLLRGAEWCLPIGPDGPIFEAPAPNGTAIRTGSVDRLLAELRDLNDNTLRLTPAEMEEAIAGPSGRSGSDAEYARFGLALLTELAEFAVVNRRVDSIE